MTEKELNQYYYIIKETKVLESDKENLSGNLLSHGENINNIINILEAELRKLMEQREKIESYINSIDDTQMRLIMRYRHISQMTWEQIGRQMYMSPSGVFKKYKKFLKESEKEQ